MRKQPPYLPPYQLRSSGLSSFGILKRGSELVLCSSFVSDIFVLKRKNRKAGRYCVQLVKNNFSVVFLCVSNWISKCTKTSFEMGEMSVILLVLAVAFCWSQSASNANVAQFSATPDFTFAATEIGSASVQQELKRSDERTSPTSTQAISTINLNSEEDLLQSKICETCACQDGTPSVVDCSSKSLTAPFLLPEWPQGHLISSIDARFENNNFIEVRQFPELPLLKLSFRGNGIQFIEKEAFKFLKMLEYLDLSENNLTHESLNENVFIGPFNDEDYEPIPLKTLKLGYNKIVSINNDAFKHLSHLETLELNNNPLKVIDHQTAIAITTLRKLKVGFCSCK